MNKRLTQLLQTAAQTYRGGAVFLDCYNQTLYHDTAPTITTRIYSSQNYYIMEEIKDPLIHANLHGYYEGGEYPETSPAVRSSAFQANTAVAEPIIASMRGRDKDNPTGVRTANNGNFAQRLEHSADQSTSNTLTSVAKDNLIVERVNTKNYVVEPQVQQVGQLVPDSKFANPQRGRIYSPAGVAPSVDTAQGGNLVAKIIEQAVEPTRQDLIQYHLTDDGNLRAYIDDEKKTGVSELQITNPDNPAPTLTGANHAKVWQSIEELIEQAKTAHLSRGIILIKNTPCWVRRLTERELFRLMDVDETDIDTLLNAGISNTQLAKLAGNSIVTACMYYIFHALFIETTPPPNTQTQLF